MTVALHISKFTVKYCDLNSHEQPGEIHNSIMYLKSTQSKFANFIIISCQFFHRYCSQQQYFLFLFWFLLLFVCVCLLFFEIKNRYADTHLTMQKGKKKEINRAGMRHQIERVVAKCISCLLRLHFFESIYIPYLIFN